MNILVGYTGFVGSNIKANMKFDYVFNSKNIEDAFGLEPDLLVYAGVPAEKFIANKNPEQDRAIIENAIENIKKINPKKIVLISTIDVFNKPNNKDENAVVDEENLEAYGLNRRYLEKWVESNINQAHILRLPGLFGKNIKKNFIYDCIHYIPKLLNETKYNELKRKDKRIEQYYDLLPNGFYGCNCTTDIERRECIEVLKKIGFSALNFTDSRGLFQFYNLFYLSTHIEIAINNNLKYLHLAVEPVRVSELYDYLYHEVFVNEIVKVIPIYDFKTCYNQLFQGSHGYIFSKTQVLKEIKEFIEGEQQ
ncbi:NAD(P)-dependent oxidoreductase [Anaerorhabdus sp.]|uniref:NAD(P)-dependent oxidoreductase n=1 Tax=Anaerorhabdus sp. TaxID=1872524 RepID=UPI002FC9835E